MKRAALVLVAALAAPVVTFAQAPPAPPAPPRHPHTGAGQRHERPTGPATSVDEKRPAAPDASVSIENLAGSTKVTGWDRAEVQVRGTVAEGATLEFDGTENRLHIEVDIEHGDVEHGPLKMRKSQLEVFVPSGCSVSVEGFNAAITLSGVAGKVKAETVNGSISHSGASKDVQLQSVNGAIETTKGSGRMHVEAVNGTVTVRDASGELNASTVNGKLAVLGGSFSHVQLEAVSGPVRFEGVLAPKGTLGVETVSGPVDLFFPSGADADFTVTTFSGSITNELGPAAQKKDEWTPEKELVFTSGKGGAQVTVETLSGAVSIRKRTSPVSSMGAILPSTFTVIQKP